jgi:hypothetical protein
MGIDMNNVVKLCDFGFAREILDPEKKLTGYVGTPIYMVSSYWTHWIAASIEDLGIVVLPLPIERLLSLPGGMARFCISRGLLWCFRVPKLRKAKDMGIPRTFIHIPCFCTNAFP